MDLSVDAASIVLALAAAGSLLFVIFLNKRNADNSYPPMVGTVFQHLMNLERVHDYHTDHAERHRTFRVVYPTFSYVFTTDPANVEHILRTNFENYGKGKFNYDIMKDLLGDGIFTVDGDRWRQQRKLASLEFSTKVLKDFSSVEFRNSAVKLSNFLLEVGRKSQTVEMQDPKYTFSDDMLPDGFKIKKGDMVNYVPYSMGRMTYLWGSDAKEFRPERWLQNGIFQPQSPFKFTTFQGGARICLGKDFAYMQMKIIAAVLVRFFKFEAAEGKEVKYCLSLTLHMNEDGLNLHVTARSDF